MGVGVWGGGGQNGGGVGSKGWVEASAVKSPCRDEGTGGGGGVEQMVGGGLSSEESML